MADAEDLKSSAVKNEGKKMVTDLVRFGNILQAAQKENMPPELIEKLQELKQIVLADKEKRKRQPRPPAPIGGISEHLASVKYNIPYSTLRGWANKSYVKIISRTKYETFIDEKRVAQLAIVYHSDPGRGSWAVKKLILEEQNNS